MSEWIKCSEKMPSLDRYGDSFLVYGSATCGNHCPDPVIREAILHSKGYFIFGEYDCHIDATHWMEMPKAPTE